MPGLRNVLVLALIALFIGASACSSRPRATEQETLYWNHSGKKVIRKRSEKRTRQVKYYDDQGLAYYETEHFTVFFIELESPKSSGGNATPLQLIFHKHGGKNLRRKRTETRSGEVVVVLEIEDYDGNIVDVDVSVKIGNQLREGEPIPDLPHSEAMAAGLVGRKIEIEVSGRLSNQLRVGERIPSLTIEQAARAGLVGDSVEVTMVYGGSQAETLGIQEEDIIIRYNGQNMLGTGVFSEAIAATKPGDTVKILIERDGEGIQLTAKGGDLGVQVEDHWR